MTEAPKPSPHWPTIEADYRAGVKSVRQIAREHGLTEAAVRKRSRRDAWVRDLERSAAQQAVLLDRPPVVLQDKAEKPAAGFVYVIYLEDSASERFYKIGMSTSFSDRFDAHQCASPFKLCVACAYFVGNARSEEAHLHAYFWSKRVRGEWFRLTDDDLVTIAARAKLV